MNPPDDIADQFSLFPPIPFTLYDPHEISLPLPDLNPNPTPLSAITDPVPVPSSIQIEEPSSTHNILSFSIPKKRRRGRPQRGSTSFTIPQFPTGTLNPSSNYFPSTSNSFRNGVGNSNSLPHTALDTSDEIIVINRESTAEAVIALTAGFPADSLTDEEIDAGVVPVIGGIEQVNYILIRNHIIAKWRENVSNWIAKDMFIGSIPKHCQTLLDSAYNYLVSHGFINFGVAPAVRERIPAEPSKPNVVIIGAGFAGLAAARQMLRFGFKVTVLEGRKRAGGRVYTKKMEGGGNRVSAAAELGGSVLTGTSGNPLGIVARQLGSTLHKVRDKCPLYQNRGESDDTAHQKSQALIEEPTIGSEKSLETKILHTYNLDAEDDSCVKHSVSRSPSQPSASFNNNQDSKASPSSPAVGYYGRHSTLTDPNFVENYFKSSRLHFIGTWRNRYRRRFPCQSKGFKNTNSNHSSADSLRTAIIHIDMDCFFVSVVIRNDHKLKDKPVAVCHSDSPKGTAEISAANYPARVYGVRAGMFVRDAKALCPHLVICPYNFEAYEEVADQFYNILHKHCKKVQAVSCDEAFLDVTGLEGKDPEILASTIRKEIFETTGCTASAGIGGNMLISRLATRNAKPDGQCYIPPEKVDDYLRQLPIKELPGIGHVLQEKLKKQNVHTCGQLCLISKECLQKDFGAKTGEMLWNYSRGIDTRLVGIIQESKSIGAEVNWGVRFNDPKDSQNFLLSLCKEVSLRLQGCGVQGRTFILKIKKRRKDAEEPAKYLGCGDCENLSHSLTVPVATDDVEVLKRITKQLFGMFNIDVKEIRGVGLQVSKLENADSCRQGSEKNSLKSWLKSSSVCSEKCDYVPGKKTAVDCEGLRSDGVRGQLYEDTLVTNSVDNKPSNGESSLNSNSAPPPFSHLDFGVIENLPPDIFSELNEIYGGKLVDFVAKSKSKGKGKMNEGERLPHHNLVLQDKLSSKDEVKQPHLKPSTGGSHDFLRPDLENTDLMPSSLSQVDASVLQQLPQELRVDILEQLPAHRLSGLPLSSSLSPNSEHPYPQKSLNINEVENNLESTDSMSNCDLWVGSPPKWVDEFSVNNCVILNTLAEMYYKSGSNQSLSSVLRCITLECQGILDAPGYVGWQEAINKFLEVVKQYVKLKIELDIEEIYICFRLIQRFMSKSKFLLHVYDSVFPYLQASVSESYGGNLRFG